MSLLQLVYYICGNASTTLVPILSSQLLPSLWRNGNKIANRPYLDPWDDGMASGSRHSSQL